MVKNICQNPTCWTKRTKDQWNKKANAYQSRKAYSPNGIYQYFCTTSCFHNWAYDNLENIIERKHCPDKITEKIIGS
mgnify:CR=1 FL=1|jgi:hypothetical protein